MSDETKTKFDIYTPSRHNLDAVEYEGFQIYKEGFVELIGSSLVVTINHGLGYIPTYLAYAKEPDNFAFPPLPLDDSYTLLPLRYLIRVRVTNQLIEFDKTPIGTQPTIRIYYYIFREKAR